MGTDISHRLVTTDDLEKFKSEMIVVIRLLLAGHEPRKNKRWLKSAEVRKRLGISPGKLQGIRESGLLPYTRIGGNIYYEEEDIFNLFETNKSTK